MKIREHTTYPDQRALHISIRLELLIAEIKDGNLGQAKEIAMKAKDEADLLCNELDPCNTQSAAMSMYAGLLRPERLAELYGRNVVPFHCAESRFGKTSRRRGETRLRSSMDRHDADPTP